ncbi:MAG: OmpA family protein [Bdellovibrio sp.]|nr:OmpA family protein [Bdellovibrio sp.]
MKIFILILSAMTLFFMGCASDQKNTAKGAGIGAGVGAVAGAIIGHQTGNRTQGALIGAALGAGTGSIIGNRLDKQAKELEQIAETKRTENGLVTKLKSDILFDSGKSALKPGAQSNLKQMADIMKKYPENVLTIKGYTDSTGSSAINTSLSQKRADAVKVQLVAAGLPASTISTAGLGPSSPVGDNKTDLGRKQNRRVDVEVTVDESKVPKK